MIPIAGGRILCYQECFSLRSAGSGEWPLRRGGSPSIASGWTKVQGFQGRRGGWLKFGRVIGGHWPTRMANGEKRLANHVWDREWEFGKSVSGLVIWLQGGHLSVLSSKPVPRTQKDRGNFLTVTLSKSTEFRWSSVLSPGSLWW